MGQRLGKDHGGAGLAGYGSDEGLVGLEVAPLVREPEVALVAAGYAAESAVAWIDVLQVVGHHGQAATDLFVGAGVGVERVEGNGAAVEGRADGTVAFADDIGVVVVQPVLWTDQLFQVRIYPRVVYQCPVRGSPVEQRETESVGGGAGRHGSVDLLVQYAVQFGELPDVNGVRDLDEALQVEEVSFVGSHA